MYITEFLKELENSDEKIKSCFGNIKLLKNSLIELNEVIGMDKIKKQIIKQIKTHIVNKTKGITNKDLKERKHCLLCGPPGCGKTTVGKILCKIWVGIGFIGQNSTNTVPKKLATFNKVQDELIRNQRQNIKEYKDKLKIAISTVNNTNYASNLCKKSVNNLIKLKSGKNNPILDELINDISSAKNSLEEIRKIIPSLNSNNKSNNMQGFGLESNNTMITTKEDSDLPFYVYNRNDLISRFVGDTTHRTTIALTEALDGVAYFDEAYNLCNNTNSMGDPYGQEALTAINQFMDDHSDKLIVVFAGYKNEIINNLFESQPGLKSRFMNKFEIEEYTSDELTKILIQRLRYSDWHLKESNELRKLIKDNFELFKFQGRDMDTLSTYITNVISEKAFEDILEGKEFTKNITNLDIVREALEIFKDNTMSGSGNNNDNNDFKKLVNLLRT